MLPSMTDLTKGDQIFFRVIAQLASEPLVVNLQVRPSSRTIGIASHRDAEPAAGGSHTKADPVASAGSLGRSSS